MMSDSQLVKRAETELDDPVKREQLLNDYYQSHKNEVNQLFDLEIKKRPKARDWDKEQYHKWIKGLLIQALKKSVEREKERIERYRLREKQALELEQQKRECEAAARRQRQEREREQAEDYRRQQEQKRRRERELREAPRRAVKITKRHFKRVGLEKIPSKEERLLEAWRIDWSELEHLFEDKKKLEQMCKQAVKVAIVQLDREEKERKREDRLAGREQPQHEPVTVSKDWLGLREMLYSLCIEKGLSERDSLICSHFMVPPEAGMTKVAIRQSLLEGRLKNLQIRQPTFNSVIKRKLTKKGSTITGTDLGRIGEAFTHRLCQGAIECHMGPRPHGVCDISDKESGDPAEATWAVNVKVSLEDEVNRGFVIAPEHQVSKSWCLLIMPRLLMMKLYPITSENMTLNSTSGGLCVTPSKLPSTLKEMIES